MDQERMEICMKFKNQLITMLEDIYDAATCIIPLGSQDRKIIKEGLNDLDGYISKLKLADNLRDLNQFIDVDRYLDEHDSIEEKLQNNKKDDGFLKFMESTQNLCHKE